MSKNEHMHASEQIVGAHRPTAGTPSLAQGVYGDGGNLELVVPDTEDGIWVFWFNADAADAAYESVRPGTWSDGLRFADGDRWLDAWIVQSTLGPDHLEALALRDNGAVVSWFWSPEHGFQRRDAEVATGATAIALAHEAGVLVATVRDADGERHLRAGVEDYPARQWAAATDGPALRDPLAAERLAGTGVDLSDVDAATIRSARSTRLGGTLELTWRDSSGRVHHLGVHDSSAWCYCSRCSTVFENM